MMQPPKHVFYSIACMTLFGVLPEAHGLVHVGSEVGSGIRVRIRDCGPKTNKWKFLNKNLTNGPI